jgi:phospholipid/cholesterol/gamma-HCH transport system substrate-binding protein
MKRYSLESVVGIFVVMGLISVGYMTVKLGKVSLFGNDYYTLYARFSSVSGLRVNSPVEVNGIEVGMVSGLRIDQEKQMAIVELKIKRGIRIYDDASATIKTSGLIGDKFIKIDPGGAGDLLKPGDTITETSSPVDIEDLISKYLFGDIGKSDKKEAK